MATPLSPIIDMETGRPHPDFPRNYLAFYLLTSNQLDSLTRHFHQVYPILPMTLFYPFQIRAWVGAPDEPYVDIATKRQRFGHFVGMWPYLHPANSGLPQAYADSPEEFAVPTSTHVENCEVHDGDQHDDGGDDVEGNQQTTDNAELPDTVEELLGWMDREWEAGLREARARSDGPFYKH